MMQWTRDRADPAPGSSGKWLGGLELLKFGCGFFLFVLFPALITWRYPTTVITVERSAEGSVTARTRSLLLLAIPFDRAELEDLRGVRTQVTRGERLRRTPGSSRRTTERADDDGVLRLDGDGASLEVPASPATLENHRSKIAEVLDGKRDSALVLTASLWKITLLALPFSILGLFYLVSLPFVVIRAAESLPERREADARH